MNISSEKHILGLVKEFSTALSVEAPAVRFVNTVSGARYKARSHRIEIDEGTLGLTRESAAVVVARTVGHATQREEKLKAVGGAVMALVAMLGISAIPSLMSPLSCSLESLCRVFASVSVFVFLLIAYVSLVSPRADARWLRLDIEADALAARLCGPRAVMDSLESISRDGRYRFDEARLKAMRVLVCETSPLSIAMDIRVAA